MASIPSNSGPWSGAPLTLPDSLFPGGQPLPAWLADRPLRVALLLAAVFMLNVFDLFFTILANRLGCFIELNPVAAIVLGDDNYLGLALYKAALVGVATCILWRHRRHRFSELSCWLATLLYAVVTFRWHRYYEVFNFHSHYADASACLGG